MLDLRIILRITKIPEDFRIFSLRILRIFPKMFTPHCTEYFLIAIAASSAYSRRAIAVSRLNQLLNSITESTWTNIALTLSRHRTNTGPILNQYFTNTEPTLNQYWNHYWTNNGPILDQHWNNISLILTSLNQYYTNTETTQDQDWTNTGKKVKNTNLASSSLSAASRCWVSRHRLNKITTRKW